MDDDTNAKLVSVDRIPFHQRNSNNQTRFGTYPVARPVVMDTLAVVVEPKGPTVEETETRLENRARMGLEAVLQGMATTTRL